MPTIAWASAGPKLGTRNSMLAPHVADRNPTVGTIIAVLQGAHPQAAGVWALQLELRHVAVFASRGFKLANRVLCGGT